MFSSGQEGLEANLSDCLHFSDKTSIKICHVIFSVKINTSFTFSFEATYDVFSSPTTSDEPEISESHTGIPNLSILALDSKCSDNRVPSSLFNFCWTKKCAFQSPAGKKSNRVRKVNSALSSHWATTCSHPSVNALCTSGRCRRVVATEAKWGDGLLLYCSDSL